MNKLITLIALIAVFFTGNIFAQKSGIIVQEVTDVEIKDENMAAYSAMLKGSTMKIYFSNDKVVTKADLAGGMMSMTTFAETETKTGFMLFDMSMMGMKYKVNIEAEDVAKGQENSANIKVTYDKADTKEIVGYKCHKAIISSPDMAGATITAYVTDDLDIKADVIQGVSASLIEGFPLEYSIGAPGMTMVYTTIDIKNETSASDFEINTSGFEELTMKEFESKMASMGGLGF